MIFHPSTLAIHQSRLKRRARQGKSLIATLEDVVNDLIFGFVNGVGVDAFTGAFLEYEGLVITGAWRFVESIMLKPVSKCKIREMNDKLSQCFEWIKKFYLPTKQQDAPKEVLCDALLAHCRHHIGVVTGQLMEEDHSEVCFGAFLIAASIHIVLLQELAFMDPTVTDPDESKYVSGVRHYSKKYAFYANNCLDRIEDTRTGLITELEEMKSVRPPASSHVPWIPDSFCTVSFIDEFNGFQYHKSCKRFGLRWETETPVKLKEQGRKFRNGYIRDSLSRLYKILNRPLVVIGAWNARMEHPLPKQKLLDFVMATYNQLDYVLRGSDESGQSEESEVDTKVDPQALASDQKLVVSEIESNLSACSLEPSAPCEEPSNSAHKGATHSAPAESTSSSKSAAASRRMLMEARSSYLSFISTTAAILDTALPATKKNSAASKQNLVPSDMPSTSGISRKRVALDRKAANSGKENRSPAMSKNPGTVDKRNPKQLSSSNTLTLDKQQPAQKKGTAPAGKKKAPAKQKK